MISSNISGKIIHLFDILKGENGKYFPPMKIALNHNFTVIYTDLLWKFKNYYLFKSHV